MLDRSTRGLESAEVVRIRRLPYDGAVKKQTECEYTRFARVNYLRNGTELLLLANLLTLACYITV